MTILYSERNSPPVRENVGTCVNTLADLEPAVSLFHGLSDPTRLAIIRFLSVREYRVIDLTEKLGLAQSTISAHLSCLRDCGLVTSRAQGRASLFTLSQDAGPVLRNLLTAAEQLLIVTSDTIDLCLTYGTVNESSRTLTSPKIRNHISERLV
ncbi:winged helix-turn-helix transcriptional regulator [Candidatus Saccharibacteria bacterium]|nr:winged helix-turn-helix transcriptional regulator [Candidatus Saccharibacteria bacterium]